MGMLLRHTPQVILLDINMLGLNGLDAMKYIKRQYASVKAIALSTYQEQHLVQKAKTLGADGYLLKDAGKSVLVEAIRKVTQGDAVYFSEADIDQQSAQILMPICSSANFQ